MEPREIIPRTRSVVAAGGAFISSAGVVALATGIVLDAGLPWFGQVATFGVGALFALPVTAAFKTILAYAFRDRLTAIEVVEHHEADQTTA